MPNGPRSKSPVPNHGDILVADAGAAIRVLDTAPAGAEEAATGCVQHGALGSLYVVANTDDPPPITPKEALDKLIEGFVIAVPNAGAGSYKTFFKLVGFKDVKVIEWSSSAGDWTFGVQDEGGTWMVAFQNNRYPRHGFTYSVQSHLSGGTFEELFNYAP